ncbi:MAG TPA: carboxypeptidase regulatory-like domain-containing protein, partial [Blastocatellia bacterium]|nr:carboxypeptidase regulatory-like domain-containing protein [Blastocatellia bacterium]
GKTRDLAATSAREAACAPRMAAFAQQAAAEDDKQAGRRNGVITGRVVTADGQPLAETQIVAFGPNIKLGEPQQVATDEEGNFKLTGLRPGVYQLTAMMPGYVSPRAFSEAPMHRPGDNVTITLVKGGVITGRVMDVTGEALVGVSVTPRRIRDAAGHRVSAGDWMTGLMHSARTTDDRGVYRLYGLAAGDYVVGINGSSAPMDNSVSIPRESPTFHPSATRDTAAEIAVREGAEVTGIDIRHRAERGHAVSGALSGEVESDAIVNVISILLRNPVTGQVEAMTMALGSRNFALYGVADGEYELIALRQNESDDRAMSAPRRVSVKGADVTGVELKLLKLGSIAGKILIEKAKPGESCPPPETYSAQEISLRANREDQTNSQSLPLLQFDLGGLPFTQPNEKNEFTVKNLEAGSYRLAADLPGENWFVRSLTQPATQAGKRADAARQPFALKQGEKRSGIELTVAEGAAALSGKAIAARKGQPLRVHLIPADAAEAENLLRYAEVVAEGDGAFAFKQLAPGKYWLLARPAAEAENKLPAAFDAAERAKLRREAEAQKTEVTLSPCQRAKDITVNADLK